jgi:hypothetical protein
MIEHSYIQTSAGRVHQSAKLVHDAARDFIAAYRAWVETYLNDDGNHVE